jgi:hypothetical protein
VCNIPLCKNNHKANTLQILRISTSYVSLGCINFLFTALYYYIHEIIIFPLIFAIFCSGRGDIPLCKANHYSSAPVIAHSSRPYGPLRSIKFLLTPLHHYIHEIMIFIPIFAILCAGRGKYALVLEQPPGLCPSNRTSTTPMESSSMYQLALPSISLLLI